MMNNSRATSSGVPASFSQEKEVELFKRYESTERDLVRSLLRSSRGPQLLTRLSKMATEDHDPDLIRGLNGQLDLPMTIHFSSAGVKWLRWAVKELSNDDHIAQLTVAWNNAKRQCIELGYGLVLKSSRRYASPRALATFDDLIQEGNIGVIRAVEMFDVERGFRFSTFAIWHIRANQKRASENSFRIIFPEYIRTKVNQLARIEQKYRALNGRDPSSDELRKMSGLSSEELDTIHSLRNMKIVSESACGEDSIFDFISDDSIIPQDATIESSSTVTGINEILNDIPEMEREVITLRSGFGREGCLSIEDIGIRLNIPVVKVRRIESCAKRRLRGVDFRKRFIRLGIDVNLFTKVEERSYD